MKKIIGTASAIVILGSLIGGWICLDERFAHAKDVERAIQALENRLENKIIQDRLDFLDQRIWKIEDRYPKGEMPIMVLDQYRGLKKERKKLEQQMKENAKPKSLNTNML